MYCAEPMTCIDARSQYCYWFMMTSSVIGLLILRYCVGLVIIHWVKLAILWQLVSIYSLQVTSKYFLFKCCKFVLASEWYCRRSVNVCHQGLKVRNCCNVVIAKYNNTIYSRTYLMHLLWYTHIHTESAHARTFTWLVVNKSMQWTVIYIYS